LLHGRPVKLVVVVGKGGGRGGGERGVAGRAKIGKRRTGRGSKEGGGERKRGRVGWRVKREGGGSGRG